MAFEIIRHRRNTAAELLETDPRHGVEIDLRADGEDIVLQHDPFQPGERFSDWLEKYDHGTLILNVKEDGLETRIIESLEERGVADFFFLDQPFPSLIKMIHSGERRCAIRVSEYEPVDVALALSAQIGWAWIDCFTRFPLSRRDALRLTEAPIKTCLVSPELQGRSVQTIAAYRAETEGLGFTPDAVCTKAPDLWS